MDTSELYTEQLEERIYSENENSTNEDVEEQLNSFLEELLKRRRDDPVEGGLQASMLIMPTAFAAKVTENDGNAPHALNNINLLRYINNEDSFYTSSAGQRFALIHNEHRNILSNGITIRILNGQDRIMLAVISKVENITNYQLDILEKLVELLKQLKEQQYYKSVEIGLATPTSRIEMEDMSSEMYSTLQQAIENERRGIEQQEDTKSHITAKGEKPITTKKDVQKLGSETIAEQKDTAYIDETEHSLEAEERAIKSTKDNTQSL